VQPILCPKNSLAISNCETFDFLHPCVVSNIVFRLLPISVITKKKEKGQGVGTFPICGMVNCLHSRQLQDILKKKGELLS
jgi:hypothetical protein